MPAFSWLTMVRLSNNRTYRSMKRDRHTSGVNIAAADGVDPRRSALMARVRSKDSKPELVVRKLAHRLGYRFRLHRKDLPGTPDLIFPRLRKVILVHRCFWHQHKGCRSATIPQIRQAYWLRKLARNKQRDLETLRSLSNSGWSTLVVWGCEIQDARKLEVK